MVKHLKISSKRMLKDYSDLIESADNFKDLLGIKKNFDSNPIWPEDLRVDDKLAELNFVTETITKLNKKITKKLDTKGKKFWRQEFRRLQQFPNEEEQKVMKVQHFRRIRDYFVAKKARNFEDLDKWVINNYFDVQKNYLSIRKGIEKYIHTKVDGLLSKQFEELEEIGTEIVVTYDKEVLSKLRSDKIENIQDFPKNYILNSINKVKDQIYKKTKSIYFDDSYNDEDLNDGIISTNKTTIKDFSDKLTQETLQKIHEKLNQKVYKIRDEFKCLTLLNQIKTQSLNSMSEQTKQGKMSLDQIKQDERHKAENLFLKIENFMMITIPKLNSSKGEYLIDRDAVGYYQLKNQFQIHLFIQMDNILNDIKQKELQQAKEIKELKESKVLKELKILQKMNKVNELKKIRILEEMEKLDDSKKSSPEYELLNQRLNNTIVGRQSWWLWD